MNVVDSSGWMEYFAGSPAGQFFAPAINDTERLVVPSISIFEVFKKFLRERGESQALAAAAQMRTGLIVPLSGRLAQAAAKLSVESQLALADSVILATARLYEATLWTQDADFAALENVKFRPKDKTVI